MPTVQVFMIFKKFAVNNNLLIIFNKNEPL
jgi:hypothetical protein